MLQRVSAKIEGCCTKVPGVREAQRITSIAESNALPAILVDHGATPRLSYIERVLPQTGPGRGLPRVAGSAQYFCFGWGTRDSYTDRGAWEIATQQS